MIVVRNTRSDIAPKAPVSADGTPYRYEMIFDGLRYRAYADSLTELCAQLIPGYADLEDDAQQAAARIRYAVTEQADFRR